MATDRDAEHGDAMRLALCAPPRPLRAVPRTIPAEVQGWFAERVPLVVPPDVLPLLDRWAQELRGEAPPSLPGWTAEGPGRSPVEAAPLIDYLRERARAGEDFTFNALWLEKQGGRLYPFFLRDYQGPLTVSRRQYDAAKHSPRLLLSAIRRDVRAALQPPPGWSLLELDFKSCHPAIGLALSGDEQLAADLEGDMHQHIGDRLVPQLPTAQRRTVGKAVNNAMLFGLSPSGLRRYTREILGRDPLDSTGETVWQAWWARYPRLAAFRDGVRDLVDQAQLQGCALEIEAPSGRVSRFSAAEVAGQVAKSHDAPGPDGAWRTVFSACFRAVEGDLLNQVLRHFSAHAAGGRPVLPLYDGMLIAAPTGAENAVSAALMLAAEQAVRDLQIPKLRADVKAR